MKTEIPYANSDYTLLSSTPRRSVKHFIIDSNLLNIMPVECLQKSKNHNLG